MTMTMNHRPQVDVWPGPVPNMKTKPSGMSQEYWDYMNYNQHLRAKELLRRPQRYGYENCKLAGTEPTTFAEAMASPEKPQ